MRKSITFTSRGLRCRGWLYVPDDLAEGQKASTIVMAHGFTGVKEMTLPDFAEQFAKTQPKRHVPPLPPQAVAGSIAVGG